MKTRKYTATARIHENNSLQYGYRSQLVQFEYFSQHRNGSRDNIEDCKLAAIAKYGKLAIPSTIIFTHIIRK